MKMRRNVQMLADGIVTKELSGGGVDGSQSLCTIEDHFRRS
jgi:hypothetical protein